MEHFELAPATWFVRREQSSVWIAGYRVFRLRNQDALARQPIVASFEQLRVRLHLYVGDLKHTDFSALRLRRDGSDRYTRGRQRRTRDR